MNKPCLPVQTWQGRDAAFPHSLWWNSWWLLWSVWRQSRFHPQYTSCRWPWPASPSSLGWSSWIPSKQTRSREGLHTLPDTGNFETDGCLPGHLTESGVTLPTSGKVASARQSPRVRNPSPDRGDVESQMTRKVCGSMHRPFLMKRMTKDSRGSGKGWLDGCWMIGLVGPHQIPPHQGLEVVEHPQ